MFGISAELSDKMSNSKASKDIFKEVASCHKSIGGRVFCKFFLLFFVILDMNHSFLSEMKITPSGRNMEMWHALFL